MKEKLNDVLSSWAEAKISRISQNIKPESPGVTLVCVTRNEGWRLPCFMEHYRALGIERFVFIDNDSDDNSREYLSSQADVDLFLCQEEYSPAAQRGWMHQVMDLYGIHRWYLCLDTDELLVYDGMAEHSLQELAGLLRREGTLRARGILIEMYGDGSRKEYLELDDCKQVQQQCRYFDSYGYREHCSAARMEIEGGVRERIFRDVGYTKSFPELSKYPLFFLEEEDIMTGGHQMLPEWKNYIPECIVGILHYKFSKYDFEKIEEALQRLQHWNGSLEYKIYAKWFSEKPDASFVFEGTREYSSPADLIEAGLICPLDWSKKRLSTRFPLLSVSSWKSAPRRKRILRMAQARLKALVYRKSYAAVRKLRENC